MPDCPYTAALDAGDRLVTALQTGDLGGAARVLGERSALIASLRQADAAAPPHLADRFRQQDAALNAILGRRLSALGDAVSSTGRAALAHDRYASASGPLAPVLDTAPRGA